MSNTTIPATGKEAWGFWGAMNEHATTAWPMAMAVIADATGEDLDNIRAFLDSRLGRHFADDVQNGLYEGKTLRMRSTLPPSAGWVGRLAARQPRITASRAAWPTSRAS